MAASWALTASTIRGIAFCTSNDVPTVSGYEISLPVRNYGWKTDVAGETEELIALIYQGSTIEKEPLYSIGRLMHPWEPLVTKISPPKAPLQLASCRP